jgi:hypothetical protein
MALMLASGLAAADDWKPSEVDDDREPTVVVPPREKGEGTPAKAPTDDEGPRLNPDKKYGGVGPGLENLPPRAPRLPVKAGPQRLTWTGFQVQEGAPVVFLQLTGVPSYSIDEAPGQVVVTLKNTVVPLRNNRRPLRVEHFDTKVEKVETVVRGRDVRVVIHVKGESRPSHAERIEASAGGYQMLLIRL